MVNEYEGSKLIFLYCFIAIIFLSTFVKTKARKITLKNDKGHTIIIQGTYHAADTSFYNSIFNDLDYYRANGFKILYEKVIPQHPTKKIRVRLRQNKRLFNYICSILNTSSQSKFSKKYQESDIRADIYMEDAEQHISDIFDKEHIISVFKLNSFILKFKLSIFCRYFFNLFFSLTNFISNFNKKENNNFLIGTRNKVILHHIDYSKNNYIHYGEGHLNDLIIRLQKLNYQIVSISKLRPLP